MIPLIKFQVAEIEKQIEINVIYYNMFCLTTKYNKHPCYILI